MPAVIASPASDRYNLRKRTSHSALHTAAAVVAPPTGPISRANNKLALSEKEEDAAHHEYEFGGPLGTLGMMTFFPMLFYYFYVCLFFYDGQSTTTAAVACLTPTARADTAPAARNRQICHAR